MHPSAYKHARQFREAFLSESLEGLKVLDIGSLDLNGSMAPIFDTADYIGIDICDGPNVHIKAEARDIPFKDSYFDVSISSSCFEHDPCFWMTFKEMTRITKCKW